MHTNRKCPSCNSPVPMLATECLYCKAPVPQQGPMEEPRFSVVRKAQGMFSPPVVNPGGAPGAVTIPTPPEVASIREVERVWYCRIGGQTVGPVTAADIRDAFSKGQINGQAAVGVQGRKEWFPIRALPQFASMITGVGPAPARGQRAVVGVHHHGSLQVGSAPAHGQRAHGGPPGGGAPGAPAVDPTRPWPQPAAPMPAPPPAPREDETLVVPPMPPPHLMSIGDSTGQVVDPKTLAWQKALIRYRRMTLFFGLTSAALFIAVAILIGLLTSR